MNTKATTYRRFEFGFDGARPYVQAVDWTAPTSHACSECGAEIDDGGSTTVNVGERVYVELPEGDGPWCLTVGKDNVPEWRSFMPMHGGAWLSLDRTRFVRWPIY